MELLEFFIYSGYQTLVRHTICKYFLSVGFFTFFYFNFLTAVVYKVTLFLHMRTCFFLVFALHLSFLARFGFTCKGLLAATAQLLPGDNHLTGADAQVSRGGTISFLPPHSLSAGGTFLPINLDCFAGLPPFVQSSHSPTSPSFRGWTGAWTTHCTSVSALREGKTHHLLRFLPRSEVTRGLNFILTAGPCAVAAKGKRHPHAASGFSLSR